MKQEKLLPGVVAEYCVEHGLQHFFTCFITNSLHCPLCHPEHEDNPDFKHEPVREELHVDGLVVERIKKGLEIYLSFWQGEKQLTRPKPFIDGRAAAYVGGFLAGWKARSAP